MKTLGVLTVALWLTSAVPAQAQTAPAESTVAAEATAKPDAYTRTRDGDDGVIVLELAARAFAAKDGHGPKVMLVSAVHIADAQFYAAMQSMLDAQDLVLFEGVRPPGAGAIDAQATDEERIPATRGRLDFLKVAIESHRDRDGAYPTSMADLVEHAGKRWRSLIEGVRIDAWGNTIRFERAARVEGSAETAERPERIILLSDGPDRVTQNGGGDDLRAELVVDPNRAGAKPKDGGVQMKLAKALGLTFQLEAMDSSKSNWQSSDMSIDQLEARFADSGADASQLMGMLDGSSLLGKLAGLLLDFVGKNQQMQSMAKLMLAESLAAADGAIAGGGLGPSVDKLMKVIVEERNAVVIKDLRDVIAHKPDTKTIAVFYGAGHMSGLERRLCAELGYAPTETVWTSAMRVDPRDAGYTPAQAKAMRETLRKMLGGAAKTR